MNEVEKILKSLKIPKISRKSFVEGKGQSITLGVVNQPFSKFKGYSKFTELHMDLWRALLDMAVELDPTHQFSTVTINHNVLCLPHKDVRNDGTTMIVGLGDYTGGELVVEGKTIDINHRPYWFNGYLHEHYNTAHDGDRWSVMFYSCKKTWDIIHRAEDVPIIREVYHGNQYHNAKIGFGIEKGEHWLDLGAHIGCFSKKAEYYGATVEAVEPNPKNYELLRHNISGDCYPVAVGVETKMVGFKPGSKHYFGQIVPQALEHGLDIVQIDLRELISPDCCLKMDIEGSEIAILDTVDFTGVKKMVFAYHIFKDRSRTNFLRRIERLKQWFSVVYHQEIKREEMDFFPNEIIVFCIR